MITGLSGKRVLITGASGDIGKEIVRQFASQGAFVGIHYNQHHREANILLEDVRSLGGVGVCFQANLLKSAACRTLVRSFVQEFKGIDILINNAGAVIGAKPFLKLDEASWDRTFQLNAKAPFFLSQQAFAQMLESGGGRIINISSIAAKYGGSSVTMHYGAAKASLEAMTIGLARFGAPHRILVNAIQAGFINTKFHRQIQHKKIQRRIEMIPLKKPGHPRDIAAMALYLASERGDFITGQVIGITGGD